MKGKYCINNCSCPCPILKQSRVCTDRGMKAYKKRLEQEQSERAYNNLKAYCQDMGINLEELKEMNKVKPLKESKKVIRLYKPLRYYERVKELSL